MTLTPTERPKSVLARALRWKPRTHLGVWVVAVMGGAIYFAGESVYSDWSLSVRLALALSLVGLSAVSGSLKLRSRVRGQRWSSAHPITLNRTFPETRCERGPVPGPGITQCPRTPP